jgi:tetratricopeptide (TPR) repeat protein
VKHRKKPSLLAWLALWAAASLLACRAHSPADGGQRPADVEWRWLSARRLDLDRRREAIKAVPEGGERDRQRAELETLTRELNRRLVAFLNADPPREGREPTERQQAALRMKSDEDLLVARQYIEEGGDFETAIAIYRAALAVDPGYRRLEDALAEAEARRFMTRALFSRVKEGMTREEVRGLLGQPNPHNVLALPERRVLGWFYPKDVGGAAAAVWFEEKDGTATVYRLDFDAVAPQPPPSPR